MAKRIGSIVAALSALMMLVALCACSAAPASGDAFLGELVDAQNNRLVVRGADETMLFATSDATVYDLQKEEQLCVGDGVKVEYHKGDNMYMADVVHLADHEADSLVFGGEVTELEDTYLTVQSESMSVVFTHDDKTKVTGDLSQGDSVTVTYEGDLSANPNALSITVIQEQKEKAEKSIQGTVSEVADDSIIVSIGSAHASRFYITPETKFSGDDSVAKVGDKVYIIYTGNAGDKPVAKSISIVRMKQSYFVMDGVIGSVSADKVTVQTSKKNYTFNIVKETRIQNPDYLKAGHRTTITYVGNLDENPTAASIFCSKDTVTSKEKEKASKSSSSSSKKSEASKSSSSSKKSEASKSSSSSKSSKSTKATESTSSKESKDSSKGKEAEKASEDKQSEEPVKPAEKQDADEGIEPTPDQGADEGTEDQGDQGDQGTEPDEDQGADEGADDQGADDQGADDQGDQGTDDQGDQGTEPEEDQGAGDQGADDQGDQGMDEGAEPDEGQGDQGTEPSEDEGAAADDQGDEGAEPATDEESSAATENEPEATADEDKDATKGKSAEDDKDKPVVIKAKGTIVKWGDKISTFKVEGGATVKLNIKDAKVSGGYIPQDGDEVVLKYEKDTMKLLSIQLEYRPADAEQVAAEQEAQSQAADEEATEEQK